MCRALPASARRSSCLPRGSCPRRRRPPASVPVSAHGARGAPTAGRRARPAFPVAGSGPRWRPGSRRGGLGPPHTSLTPLPEGDGVGAASPPHGAGGSVSGPGLRVPSARPFLQGRLLCDSARGGDRLCPERPRGAQGAWRPPGTLAGPRVTPPLSGRRPDGHLHDAPPGRGGGAERPRGRPAAGRAPVLRPSRPPGRGLRPGAPPDAQQTGEGPTQGPWAGAVLPGRGTSVTVTLRTRDPDPPKSVTDPSGPPPRGSREPVGREAWCPRRAPGLSTRGSRVQPREEPAVGTGARSGGEGGACGASGPGAAVAVWAEASVCRNAGATLTPRGRA